MKRAPHNQQGFILMIVMLVLILIAIIFFAFKRVQLAHGSY
jgi:Tfp pilus assembly protein PilX